MVIISAPDPDAGRNGFTMFTGGSMEGVEVKPWPKGVSINAPDIYGEVSTTAEGGTKTVIEVYAPLPFHTPAEARAFAQRIIAVADAVEAELKGES